MPGTLPAREGALRLWQLLVLSAAPPQSPEAAGETGRPWSQPSQPVFWGWQLLPLWTPDTHVFIKLPVTTRSSVQSLTPERCDASRFSLCLRVSMISSRTSLLITRWEVLPLGVSHWPEPGAGLSSLPRSVLA